MKIYVKRFLLCLIAVFFIACSPSESSSDKNLDTASDSASDINTDSGNDSDTATDSASASDSETASETGSDSGLAPGSSCDTGTYDDCFGCAMHDETVCGTEYKLCADDTSCADYETCLNDNCVADGLTGDDWNTCVNDCKKASNPTSVELYETFKNCVDCDKCIVVRTAEFPETHCASEVCDVVVTGNIKDDCYDTLNGCWGCAMAGTCKAVYDACEANDDCKALDDCINKTCPAAADWNICQAECEADNAAGKADYDAYHACIYCDACPLSCADDAGTLCD